MAGAVSLVGAVVTSSALRATWVCLVGRAFPER
jgi:hypothetical protein